MAGKQASSNTAGTPIRCRAAVGRAAGQPLVIEEVMVGPPQPREVRIRIICTSLCHSDIIFWKMKMKFYSNKTLPDSFQEYSATKQSETASSQATPSHPINHLCYRFSFCPLILPTRFLIVTHFMTPNFRVISIVFGSSLSFGAINIFLCCRVVESVGNDVDELIEGDIVIPTFLSDCGECEDCRSKKSNLCSKLPFQVSPWMHRYETSRFTDIKGDTLYHFLYVSSFSEYTVVDIAHLTKIEHGNPPSRACLLSCGVSTGVGAAWRAANVESGSTVVIFGLGTIGLAVAEGARLCGAARIIGVDVKDDKFEIGEKFGVTDFVNSRSCGYKRVSEVINEMTGRGADYCFECVGLASLVHEAFACCRKGWGKTVVVGVDKTESQLNLNSLEILESGKTLTGTLFGGLKAKSDIPILVKRYVDKELQLDEFVTHEVSFEDINKAFDLLLEGKSLRCVIWMANKQVPLMLSCLC